jgi:hypothetical protein
MSVFFRSNPVSNLYPEFCGELGNLGFVVSKPGLGKSTLCTLIGLHAMLRGDRVLHVSLVSPQQHVRMRYEQSLEHLCTAEAQSETIEIRKSIEQNRLVHALLHQPCEPSDIEEKFALFASLLDFKASIIIVDGLKVEWTQENISQWNRLASTLDCMIWIATETLNTTLPHCIHIQEQQGLSLVCDSVTIPVKAQTLLLSETASELNPSTVTLFSGGTMGAEAYFGKMAETFGLREVNFTFEGHDQKRQVGSTLLSVKELSVGATSLSYVSNVLNRSWQRTENLQKVVQVLWHIVSHADQVFIIGTIQPDGTVHGGTGWSVELAKRWHKPVWVFDQSQEQWFQWIGQEWIQHMPYITSRNIAGSGTRFLNSQGKEAIRQLYERSFS